MTTITEGTSGISSSSDRRAFYRYDRNKFSGNVARMIAAFKLRHWNFQIAYSYKTNSYAGVLKDVLESGCMIEVVSQDEYAGAVAAGFDDARIVYNGVIPSKSKYNCAKNGGIVNVDNRDEYRMLSSMAEIDGVELRIGIRVTFDIGKGEYSRFGVNVDDGSLDALVAEIDVDPHVKLCGLHCHFGSARQLEYWCDKAKVMARLAKKYSLEYIDIGGGMYGHMEEALASQFKGYVASYETYAEAVCDQLEDQHVKLIVEPGTALVGDTFSVHAHVLGIKAIGNRQIVTLDCTQSDIGYICRNYDMPIEVVAKSNAERINLEDADLMGYTCLEGDYIRRHYCGTLGIGDEIAIENVGAYSVNCCDQFICKSLEIVE